MEGQTIFGADLAAQLERFGPPGVDRESFRALVHASAQFTDLAELAERCPPERIGITPGAYSTLFGPLFGEFE